MKDVQKRPLVASRTAVSLTRRQGEKKKMRPRSEPLSSSTAQQEQITGPGALCLLCFWRIIKGWT